MKYLFRTLFFFVFLIQAVCSFAQKKDTVTITSNNLVKNHLRQGESAYIVYNKKTKESPSELLTLVKTKVESKKYNSKSVVEITQEWDRDTIVHSAYTILDATDFSTLAHNYFWKRLGYTSKYDFENRKVSFEGTVPDSVKIKAIQDFNESFRKYNLNWHSDMIIFSLLPYKENRVFKINFYDPGFGKAEENYYSVTGTAFLKNTLGEKIECWVLELKFTSSIGYQKFWITKKKPEILKEEDLFNNSYRYKLKLKIAEDN